MDQGGEHGSETRRKKSKSMTENRRRFSDEQIKLLEGIFESETRIEPRKKMQLALQLGLQPRQVSIWFQNKRARWKSKQIEQDYRALRADYQDLLSRFECLKKEKQSLLLQLQKLKELLESDRHGKTTDETRLGTADPAVNHNGLLLNGNLGEDLIQSGLDELSFGPRIGEAKDASSSASTEKWDTVDAQSCSISQWLDFWS